jgi:putative ABC transport system permease protein
LREGGRGSSAGIRTRRMTGTLLIGEIGLTLVLLVGAGLMGRSFLKMQQFDLGFETDHLITAQVQPASVRYPQPANRLAFEENLMKAVSALPGLDAVTIASQPPAGGAIPKTLNLENKNLADANQRLPVVDRIAVVPGYFQALNLKLTRGRDFNSTDGSAGAEAAIVNEPFAAKYFSGESPLGKRIRLGQNVDRGIDDPNAPWATIVGVSPGIFQRSPLNDARIQPTVYIPFRQEPTIAFTVLARSRLPQDQVIASIRSALRNVDPDLPLYNIRSVDELIRQQRWAFRVFGTLFATFALIALAISSVGIYAVTAYGVGQRTQEIGVRMALGANHGHVMWLVLRQGLVRIALGLTLGLLGAWGLSRVLASVLVGVSPTDPVTFILLSSLLATVTTMACLIPARRAMRLDPVEALRAE